MAVIIGHASADENGKSKNGRAGDQTGKEVATRDWYKRSKGWSTVFRAKDPAIAEKIAVAMEQACANNNIGYDQNQRTTLYSKARNAGWDLSKVAEQCECDCSSLVAVCVNAAGIAVDRGMYTGNQKSVLTATNMFEVFTASKYLNGDSYLKRGDILLGTGHTAVALSTGAKAIPVVEAGEKKATEGAHSFSKSVAGTYKVTASMLNVRAGAGVTKKVMVAIPQNTAVKCYGYYTTVLGRKWLYVQFTYNNVQYTGFASSKYLQK